MRSEKCCVVFCLLRFIVGNFSQDPRSPAIPTFAISGCRVSSRWLAVGRTKEGGDRNQRCTRPDTRKHSGGGQHLLFFPLLSPPLSPQAKIPQFIRGEKHTVQHFIHSSGKCGLRNNDLLWLIFHLSAQGKQLTEVLCRKCKLRHFFFPPGQAEQQGSYCLCPVLLFWAYVYTHTHAYIYI